MTRITLDEALKSKLNGLKNQVVVCDEDGEIVGNFVPTEMYQRLVYDQMRSDVSDEELARRLAEPGGSPLEDVLARLENDESLLIEK